ARGASIVVGHGQPGRCDEPGSRDLRAGLRDNGTALHGPAAGAQVGEVGAPVSAGGASGLGLAGGGVLAVFPAGLFAELPAVLPAARALEPATSDAAPRSAVIQNVEVRRTTALPIAGDLSATRHDRPPPLSDWDCASYLLPLGVWLVRILSKQIRQGAA